MASLKAGEYRVSSHLRHLPISEENPDRRDGGAHKIIVVPESGLVMNNDAYDTAPAKWVLEPKDEDSFIVKVNNRPIGTSNEGLFSTPDPKKAEEWVILQHGYRGSYTIETADRKAGWKLDSDLSPNPNIKVGRLDKLPGFPPRYPSSQLFDFALVEAY
ncbi:hypothetical protein BJ138DRAFT_1110408 [Hygrophoropsis aurantiaca]|uniref:Uncharacterized protein n=1 Tax=Hygrophoropsis aurantiaca TaxID=72124 RepID=A0ACB8AMX2_9AGAM|nr:hypothetical protein BJ138DRAFT_1110408 [Hygrophoropsis aurantiaca]